MRIVDPLRGIESKLRATALRVRLGFAATLLIGRLECAQATDFLENSLGIKLVLQTLQRAIYGLTFANDYFWHDSSPDSKNV
jgi:hypothetical protein